MNGIEISSMSHEQAVQFLRQCDNEVLLRLFRELDRTPVDLSPTDITPNSSFRPKPYLRYNKVNLNERIAFLTNYDNTVLLIIFTIHISNMWSLFADKRLSICLVI